MSDVIIQDRELSENLDALDINCDDICMKYKKKKPKPIAGLPLARTFNETVVMDLKEWNHQPTVCFLDMIDHFTRYNVPCIIRSKKKEVIVEKILK